jgi:uncharacterized protein YyaL (SSP411 family)
MNRLQNETSLYLRQHAKNPVDWYPWGAVGHTAGTATRPADLSQYWLFGLSLVPCHGA